MSKNIVKMHVLGTAEINIVCGGMDDGYKSLDNTLSAPTNCAGGLIVLMLASFGVLGLTIYNTVSIGKIQQTGSCPKCPNLNLPSRCYSPHYNKTQNTENNSIVQNDTKRTIN